MFPPLSGLVGPCLSPSPHAWWWCRKVKQTGARWVYAEGLWGEKPSLKNLQFQYLGSIFFLKWLNFSRKESTHSLLGAARTRWLVMGEDPGGPLCPVPAPLYHHSSPICAAGVRGSGNRKLPHNQGRERNWSPNYSRCGLISLPSPAARAPISEPLRSSAGKSPLPQGCHASTNVPTATLGLS